MRLGLLAALGGRSSALAAPGLATAGPGLVVGAVEDDVRASTLVEAEAQMTALAPRRLPRGARDELLDARA